MNRNMRMPGLLRFLYCLRTIVSVIAGQRPRRWQCDTSRCFFPCASYVPRATLQSYLIRHERNVSLLGKQLFSFVGEIRDFPAPDCSALLHVYARIFIRSFNGIPRFTSRTIVHFDRFWQIPWKWKLTHVVARVLSKLLQ